MSYLSYAVPLGSLALALPLLKQRLELSRAKHRSLAGHSKMAKRLAKWLPGYAFDEARFFDCDGAPAEVVAQRRAAFDLLCAGFAERYAKTLALTAQAREGLADLQFTGAYHPCVAEVVAKLQAISGHEQASFHMSGTEA
ncbi:MAG: glutamate-1-semialdehyde 2,1-aminomutase, partial [Hydrogenophaga sp.]|nr:glutamate-1-semialdehyde 2,1-aminomutase [Hydrogenophaga sp.]